MGLRRFAFRLAVAASFLLVLASAVFALDGRLVLLTLNDVHGRLYPSPDGTGGLAKAASVLMCMNCFALSLNIWNAFAA